MTMMTVIPQEFFDERAVPATVTLDGELLGALDEAPAGPWLAEMLDAVDRSTLTTFELPTYLRMCSRMQGRSRSAASPRSARSLRSLGSLVLLRGSARLSPTPRLAIQHCVVCASR